MKLMTITLFIAVFLFSGGCKKVEKVKTPEFKTPEYKVPDVDPSQYKVPDISELLKGFGDGCDKPVEELEIPDGTPQIEISGELDVQDIVFQDKGGATKGKMLFDDGDNSFTHRSFWPARWLLEAPYRLHIGKNIGVSVHNQRTCENHAVRSIDVKREQLPVLESAHMQIPFDWVQESGEVKVVDSFENQFDEKNGRLLLSLTDSAFGAAFRLRVLPGINPIDVTVGGLCLKGETLDNGEFRCTKREVLQRFMFVINFNIKRIKKPGIQTIVLKDKEPKR